jgi:hypothetical protein
VTSRTGREGLRCHLDVFFHALNGSTIERLSLSLVPIFASNHSTHKCPSGEKTVMARSYLAILKDKRKRVPFLRERKREEPLPKKEKEWGARESGKKPWLRSSLFIARSPPHFFPRRFVFLSFLLLSFSFTLLRLFTVFSFLICCTNPRSVARTEQRAKQKRGKSAPEVKKESERFLIPSRFGPTFFDFETSKNKLDPVNQQNNVGVLALADVQGQDQAPAAARERGGGAHVRTGFLLCWTKREKRADG